MNLALGGGDSVEAFGGESHWGAIIAEQTRNDGVRWKRQRGLGERLGPGR